MLGASFPVCCEAGGGLWITPHADVNSFFCLGFWFVGFGLLVLLCFLFFFFLFQNRKQVPFVKNTLSDENIEIILGKKKSDYERKHICLPLGRTDDPVAMSAFAAIGDPLPHPGAVVTLGRSPAASTASTAGMDPLSASADVQLIYAGI